MPLSFSPAALSDQPVQLASDAMARQRSVRHQRQALAREVVDDGQDTEAAPVGKRVGEEVQRPALVPALRHSRRSSRPERTLAAASFADHKAAPRDRCGRASCGSR